MNNIEVIGTTQVLKDAGIEPVQAEAIATVVVAQRDDLATKSDIAATNSSISSLKDALKSDISSLRTELKSDIAATNSSINWLKWAIGINLLGTLGIFLRLFTS